MPVRTSDQFIPNFIFKFDQVLISVSTRDLSFINEQMFSMMYSPCFRYSIHMNIIQNSALTLSFCLDNHPGIQELIRQLQEIYTVRYNEKLELITIRHFNEKAAGHVLQGKVGAAGATKPDRGPICGQVGEISPNLSIFAPLTIKSNSL